MTDPLRTAEEALTLRIYKDRQWRRVFAWYPVRCGTCNHERGIAWMEWVETRDVGEDIFELPRPSMRRTYRFIDDPVDFDDTYPHRR